MTTYYLSRSRADQKYTLSRTTLKDGENILVGGYAVAKQMQRRLNAEIPPRSRPAKPAPPTTQQKTMLTRAEFGEQVYQMVKAEIESRGFSLWVENFDPDYPCSLRTLGNIRKGIFEIETLRKLPGIQVEGWFTVETV
jgi:hypothetical protein